MTTDGRGADHQAKDAAPAADRDLQHWWRVISVLLDVPPARDEDRVKRRKTDDGKQARHRPRRRTN
jgi:hypothetical protein